jgi:aspartate aminotransferase
MLTRDHAQLAERMRLLGTEGALSIGVEIEKCVARGDDVIRLNIGEPDFDAASHIVDIAVRELRAGRSHYVDPAGTPAFRRTIATYIARTRGVEVAPERVIVTPGAKLPIAYTLQTYVDPGDEVIYPSPGFPIFESYAPYVGAVPVPLPVREENNFAIDPDDLAARITSRTRMICLVSPSNPTGNVLTKDDLTGIAEVIRERAPDAVVYSDEIYEHILYDGRVHNSIIAEDGMPERTVLASGFSKSYAMTGWRLGYAVLPSAEEADAFRRWNINTINCVPPFLQQAAITALEAPESAAAIRTMVDTFQVRRDWIVPALNAIPGMRCHMPAGAFYAFPNVLGTCKALGIMEAFNSMSPDARAASSPARLLQLFLLRRHGVATVERASFGAIGAQGEEFLRVSFASSMDLLREGVGRIDKGARDKKGFADFFETETWPESQ